MNDAYLKTYNDIRDKTDVDTFTATRFPSVNHQLINKIFKIAYAETPNIIHNAIFRGINEDIR